MMRKPVVGISYKTYVNTVDKATELVKALAEVTTNEKDVEKFVFPSLGVIYPVAQALKGSEIAFGAQNISPYENGAYTGEVSIESIIDLGGTHVEIGHAERQRIFHETLDMIHLKTKLTLEKGMTPVLCIGEGVRLDNRAERKQELKKQILASFGEVNEALIEKVILAYEPVWAIGKAEAADAAYVHQTHELIREIVKESYSTELAESVRIIYGGSVSKDNVYEITSHDDVDGVFIGRFGHDPANYKQILDTVKQVKLKG
ncbi:triose-phosphate isomerase [Oceanobacillus sojae]|uniref:Triosephosphate isomerase n=1 Tax=Oceanobacillus sojae TaxID=582851 RepID=A0A511ZR36_9BACI|nr:triose-phosphate isomerase [Oceanobacillus sojae]GEN89914.1 triosephosphate isomerase 2 [Oceanobacillus sojae]